MEKSLYKMKTASGWKESSLAYHLRTTYLFTRDDIKAIVLPQTAFGIFTALSGTLLTTNADTSIIRVLGRIPWIVLWNFANLLLFDISNQRLPASILEDSVNKSYRPLPSQRITESAARRLLLTIIPLVLTIGFALGGLQETAALIILAWMYNDLGGSDENYHVRNAINALGFMCYGAGSSAIAVGKVHSLKPEAYIWIAICGAVVFSTVSLADMRDMEGDHAKGRRTLPLVHGEKVARFVIAGGLLAWSIFVPVYWGFYATQPIRFAIMALSGLGLASRIVFLGGVAADKLSWKLWCLWIMVLYTSPVTGNFVAFT